jgi:hypothetical protein
MVRMQTISWRCGRERTVGALAAGDAGRQKTNQRMHVCHARHDTHTNETYTADTKSLAMSAAVAVCAETQRGQHGAGKTAQHTISHTTAEPCNIFYEAA